MACRKFMWLLLSFAVLTSLQSCSCSSSILGLAPIGARSHLMNVLRVGQELVERGHSFALVHSTSDVINEETIMTRSFPGLQVYRFNGPPDIGTREWAADSSRDPQEVGEQYLQRHSAGRDEYRGGYPAKQTSIIRQVLSAT